MMNLFENLQKYKETPDLENPKDSEEYLTDKEYKDAYGIEDEVDTTQPHKRGNYQSLGTRNKSNTHKGYMDRNPYTYKD